MTHAQRSAAAKKAAATRKLRGEKTGFARLSHDQRVAMAKKAAATRKARGEKPFANMTHEQRSAAAKKAAATRAAEHPSSLSQHSKLHRKRLSHYNRRPTARQLNHRLKRKMRKIKFFHAKNKHKYNRKHRLII